METKFDRCLYCFAPLQAADPCPACGHTVGRSDQPAWMLMPGTIVRGRFIIGRCLDLRPTELVYLAWDMERDRCVELVEYFPRAFATRDCTASPEMVVIPDHEAEAEEGKQRFFEKAKLYYQCVTRVEPLIMDFFVRNGTCYYVCEQNKR